MWEAAAEAESGTQRAAARTALCLCKTPEEEPPERAYALRPTRASSQRRRRRPHLELSTRAGIPSRAAFERAERRLHERATWASSRRPCSSAARGGLVADA